MSSSRAQRHSGYDVVELAKVVKAVYIQPHPGKEGVFFYNRNV